MPRSHTSQPGELGLRMHDMPAGSGAIVAQMHEADVRYLERIASDCAEVLGPGVELAGLEVESNGETVLRVRYGLGPVERVTEGRGETTVAAHAELRRRLVEDRLVLGVRALIRR